MSESVEQAALRRAAAELPAPWGSVLAAMQASERLNDSRYRHLTETRDAMYDEIAEIRDAMLALANRIESVSRYARVTDGRSRVTKPPIIPEWLCLCGARNRLRDLVCRNCGADKP